MAQIKMKNLINWLEIPASDLTRAREFYNTILGGIEFHDIEIEGTKYAMFPSEKGYSGALVEGNDHKPSAYGIVVYLDGGSDLDNILTKVESAGGHVLMHKTFIGNKAGYIAMFLDSEGNKIGLQHG